MASPTVARRASRNAVESDDIVMMRAAELAHWAKTNARAVVLATVAVLAVVGGLLYYQVYKSQRSERASVAYLQLQGTLGADTTQAIRQLQTFASNYAGTTEADEARMTIAQVWLAKAQPARAVEELKRVADGGSPVAEQARYMMGAALAQAGKRQEALDSYLKLAGDAKLDYIKADALNQAALLREQGNDWKGAADLYGQMLETLQKGSVEYQLAEMHRTEALAHLAGAPAAK